MSLVADQFVSTSPVTPGPSSINNQTFELEAGWRALIDLMSEGLAIGEVVRNEAGRVVDFRFLMQNRAADRLTGISAADLVGRLGSQLLPSEFGLWVEVFDRAVTDRLTKTYQHKFPNDPRRWNVSIIPFSGDRFALLYTEMRSSSH